jgi:hypothetical protein
VREYYMGALLFLLHASYTLPTRPLHAALLVREKNGEDTWEDQAVREY